MFLLGEGRYSASDAALHGDEGEGRGTDTIAGRRGAARRAETVEERAKGAGDAQGRVGQERGETAGPARRGGWVKMAGKILASARAHGRARAQLPRALTSRYRADER